MNSDVPDLLRGAWRRVSIHNADGSVDTSSTVVWLQLESLMADIRLRADHLALADRDSLADCSLADLQTMATSESSSGYTTCTPIETTGDVRTATAEWFTPDTGVGFQPITAYPEPGLLEWSNSGAVMIERAPSGAYVEEWHRMEDTDGPLSHELLVDGRQVFRAGSVAIVVRERRTRITRQLRLDELIAKAGDDRNAVENLVDCEFSLAQRAGDDFVITASTLPWKKGEVLDVGF